MTLITGQTGGVTLVQSFRQVPTPSEAEFNTILTVSTSRIARHLLVQDLESSHLTRASGEDAALDILQGHR